jgi:hypothetical protein
MVRERQLQLFDNHNSIPAGVRLRIQFLHCFLPFVSAFTWQFSPTRQNSYTNHIWRMRIHGRHRCEALAESIVSGLDVTIHDTSLAVNSNIGRCASASHPHFHSTSCFDYLPLPSHLAQVALDREFDVRRRLADAPTALASALAGMSSDSCLTQRVCALTPKH